MLVTSFRMAKTWEEAKVRMMVDLKSALTDSFVANPVKRIAVPFEPQNLLRWLSSQTMFPKIYWSDEENALTVAGIGAADTKECSYNQLAHEVFKPLSRIQSRDIFYYGGMCFDPKNIRDEWSGFGESRFVLPMYEIVKKNKDYYFCCNITSHNAQKAFEGLSNIQAPAQQSFHLPALNHRLDSPDQTNWGKSLEELLAAINGGSLKKLVLARKIAFTFRDTLNACDLLAELEQLSPASSRFLFQFSKEQAFFGASPERLYHREGRRIKSDALAGTRHRGQTQTEDEFLKNELMASSKDRREHDYVVAEITRKLKGLCDSLQLDEAIKILTLNHSHHLYQGIEGELKDNVTDVDILAGLHPTPAVGGVPTEEALQWIRKLEPFSRGWFAGPVGCIGKDKVDFIVAIRSALILNNTIHVYAGAGIVPGSEAKAEWQEIDYKIQNLLKVLKIGVQS